MDNLINKMQALHTQMLDVASDMDYYGGFNEDIRWRSEQLAGAADILECWINDIKAEG